MMTSSLFFQLLFCFLVFTLVLSTPIPTDVAFTKRTTSARDVYDALKTFDEELTSVLPQIDMISNSSSTEQTKSVVYTLTYAIRSVRSHIHGPMSFTSEAPSKSSMITLAQRIISKICMASHNFFIAEISLPLYSATYASPSDGHAMRNGLQQPITSTHWALLIPRLLWTILDVVIRLLGEFMLA